MKPKVLVVESPNKIEKLKHCLPDFDFVATSGHFQDLPKKALGVDVRTWNLTFEATKPGVISRLREVAVGADLFLGTDGDREGEAIAAHVARVLGLKETKRVRFSEITPKALQTAVKSAAPIDAHLVEAQTARRAVDRLVGWLMSPVLDPLGRHSVGRVQSATLHLVVEREKARQSSTPVPFWTLSATYAEGFTARAVTKGDGGKWTPARYPAESDASAAQRQVDSSPHMVEAVEETQVERNPSPPFTTSALLKAASSQLRLSPQDTMGLAQALFEKGLITYHRTDSVTLSEDAIAMAREVIAADFPAALPEVPPRYNSKASAQEAHEAIRPSYARLPSDARLSDDESALYGLIARRFLASQCRPAVLARTTVRIAAGTVRLLAQGDVVLLHGFLHYASGEEQPAQTGDVEEEEAKDGRLPKLKGGQRLTFGTARVKADATKPPSRFTEATLVDQMEVTGIGRPSTYANTVLKLFEHTYLEHGEKRTVFPSPRGRLVDGALAAACPALLSAEYTAQLEESLDRIAEGKVDWKRALTEWHRGFEVELRKAPEAIMAFASRNRATLEQMDEAPKPTGKKCPLCAAELLLRKRRDGKGAFLACSAAGCRFVADPSAAPSQLKCPACQGPMLELEAAHGRYARCANRDCKGLVHLAPTTDEACPLCGKPLKDRGAFLGCSNRPACSFTRDKQAQVSTRKCPACQGPMVEQKGKFGRYARCAKKDCKGHLDLAETTTETCPRCEKPLKDKGTFLGCSGYPTCNFTVDKKALERARKAETNCPKCGQLMVVRSSQRGPFLACLGYPTCKHVEPLPEKQKRVGRGNTAEGSR